MGRNRYEGTLSDKIEAGKDREFRPAFSQSSGNKGTSSGEGIPTTPPAALGLEALTLYG